MRAARVMRRQIDRILHKCQRQIRLYSAGSEAAAFQSCFKPQHYKSGSLQSGSQLYSFRRNAYSAGHEWNFLLQQVRRAEYGGRSVLQSLWSAHDPAVRRFSCSRGNA